MSLCLLLTQVKTSGNSSLVQWALAVGLLHHSCHSCSVFVLFCLLFVLFSLDAFHDFSVFLHFSNVGQWNTLLKLVRKHLLSFERPPVFGISLFSLLAVFSSFSIIFLICHPHITVEPDAQIFQDVCCCNLDFINFYGDFPDSLRPIKSTAFFCAGAISN